jgi:DNA modification methylase
VLKLSQSRRSKREATPEIHPRNTLNELTGSEWIKFTRTWFQLASEGKPLNAETRALFEQFLLDAARTVAAKSKLNELTLAEWLDFISTWFVVDSKRYWQNKDTELHPARYPEEMVHEFLRFFTKPQDWVFDPFAGSGSTLVACLEAGRNGVGVELSEKYAKKAQSRLTQLSLFGTTAAVRQGDAHDVGKADFWQRAQVEGLSLSDTTGLPQFDFIITSPPYWNMLRTSRGGVKSTQKQRAESGLDTFYSDDERDLGNVRDYDQFVEALGKVFDDMTGLLREGKYMVIVIQNLRTPDGAVKPLAWDLAKRVAQTFLFQGEKIWCQNTKTLGIWGYPHVFVPNYHHHYCLIFRKQVVERV